MDRVIGAGPLLRAVIHTPASKRLRFVNRAGGLKLSSKDLTRRLKFAIQRKRQEAQKMHTDTFLCHGAP